jgi:hypothetical protein
MPDARLDLRPLTGSQNRLPTVAQHRQLALLDAEALNQRGMLVLTHHTRTGHCGQVRDSTALIVGDFSNGNDARPEKFVR